MTRRRIAGYAALAAIAGLWLMAGAVLASSPAGPPYPEPVTGQRVYDNAGIFSDGARTSAEQVIRAIEDRTGAQIAVYTQVKPESDTLDAANADARALMDQWGVGRKGFDDGLVILFDMEENRVHGQCSLYAGSGFRSVFLTDADRQAIFDNDMMPLLKAQDFDGALAIALKDIDAAATSEHAAELDRARFINAAVGIGCLALAVWLAAFTLIRWYQVGRDPYYTDDSSVLMPAPPAGLTPAMATLLIDDKASNRTMSAAMIDLAARGFVHFRHETGFLSKKTEIGSTRSIGGPARVLAGQGAARLPAPPQFGTPEYALAEAIDTWTPAEGYIEQSSMSQLLPAVNKFKGDLETLAVSREWLTAKPSSVTLRWSLLGVAEFVLAGVLFWWSMNVEASGGILAAMGLVPGGIFALIMAQIMPSRTRQGSMLRAMLMAYKRTMAATMAMSSSMDEVARRKPLPWVETPDMNMAWGVALGLNDEIDAVLHRTMDQTERTGAPSGWYPMWWSTPGHGFASGGVGGGGATAGLYSSSMVPDMGSMVSALGSVGASSSSGGGGGSFGGGGGGGGGGAGGGF